MIILWIYEVTIEINEHTYNVWREGEEDSDELGLDIDTLSHLFDYSLFNHKNEENQGCFTGLKW